MPEETSLTLEVKTLPPRGVGRHRPGNAFQVQSTVRPLKFTEGKLVPPQKDNCNQFLPSPPFLVSSLRELG
jgi:hypothetical protein